MSESTAPSTPQESSWHPLGVPSGARVFQLKPNEKRPPEGDVGAHHNALPLSASALVGGLRASYGIALSTARYGPQWLLVDQDRESEAVGKFLATLPPTWTQRTKRGVHRLYRVPSGTLGLGPRGSNGRNGTWPGGELKVNGYLVGPGATVDGHIYALVDGQEPVEAPAWLVARVTPAERVLDPTEARKMIPDGERDNALASHAGFLRGRLAFDEAAIASTLWSMVAHSGTIEQPPGREITVADCQRIAHSAMSWTASKDEEQLVAAAHWIRGDDAQVINDPIRWWIRGFVPRNELTLLYGPSGAGKSSFGSWLAAEVTRQDGTFAYLGVEEPFVRFLLRAILGGAERERIYGIPNASQWLFPRDVKRLAKELREGGIDVLYVDSIYSHFPTGDGCNAAERARHCLGALAEMAQSVGVAVFGNFHENRGGEYLGSAEMIAVPRYVLRGSRDKDAKGRYRDDAPFKVAVDKQNIWDPGYAMTFPVNDVEAMDPLTLKKQYEELEDGSLAVVKMKIARRGENLTKKDEDSAKNDDVRENAADAGVQATYERAKRERPSIEGCLLDG